MRSVAARIVCLIVSVWSVSAFTVGPSQVAPGLSKNGIISRHPQTAIFSEDPTKSETPTDVAVPEPSSPPKAVEEPTTEYPLDVPSPLLLASSMILGIIGTGCVFELTGDAEQLGFAATAALTVVSIPTCLFLFYASILKATAETEEDDRRYMEGK
eukprot:CAMPEP_0198112014 /NCGR_PEP_ID=MMETSP1442-20131203/3928_1 /TAXON_ID= /ORGANISM="Craspedostauros australis, Strain CCMP3328" /LENGTH=155 /DNA_ID=CAMNT_0043768653 /DNA_START=126 /DNA_END=593 /DNA_ORIENTATION=+